MGKRRRVDLPLPGVGRADGDPVYLARNGFYLGYTRERAEGIAFTNVKDVKKMG